MFQLLLLGDPVLLDDSAAAVPVWRPAVALLALAASAGDVTRERAAGLLWPDLDEPRARRALRQVLFRLRHDVGELLLTDRSRITLNGGAVAVDVVEFERDLSAGATAAAAGRYRDDFLAGFSLPGSPAFDHWVDARRERLRAQVAQALDALVDAAAAAGDWSEALRHSQRRLDIEPLSERAAARLVALHFQSGDRARALAVHDTVSRRLLAAFGALPSGELAQVAERIRRAPTSMRRPTPASIPTDGAADAPTAGPFQLPLVGRSAELGQLMERWTLALGGARQVVVLGGEEGVGKTRLADDFRRWAATQGATTLWSRAYEIERQIPYSTLTGALRESLHAPGLAGVDERTPRELSLIVPGFERFAQPVAGTDALGLDAGRLRLLDAVRDVIDNLAYEAPVLLVVDDVQWADDASLAALNYVCRALPHSQLLVLLTARTPELAHTDGAMRLLHGLSREPDDGLRRIDVMPLDEAAIRAVLTRLGRAEAFAAAEAGALWQETGGNALFLTELLRTVQTQRGADDGSQVLPARLRASSSGARERLSALAADRLMRLPDAARRLLEPAAVIGRQFPLRLAATLAGLDAPAAAQSMDLLVRRGLLRQVEYGYDFAHGLLRSEVLDAIGPARLSELHAAVYAELVPTDAAGATEIGVERANAIAHHAARAGRHAEAHRWYLHASERAIRVYAGDEAEAALHSALEHAGDADAKCATHTRLGQLAWVRSRYGDAAREYARALEQCAGATQRLRLRIRMLDAGLRGRILHVEDADELTPQLLHEAAAAGPAPQCELLIAMAQAYGPAGRRTEALGCADRAVEAARVAAEPEPLVNALLLCARLSARATETERPLLLLQEALQVAQAHGIARSRLDVQIEIGTELSRIGRWDEAIAQLRGALRDAARCGEPGAEIVASINLSDLLVRRGDWAGAESTLDLAARIARRHDFPHADAAIRLNRALLAWLRCDDADTILGIGTDAAARAAEAGLHAVERAACALLVLSRLEAGDASGAAQHASRLEAVAGAAHVHWADDQELAVVASARFTRAAGTGDHVAARLEAAMAGAVSTCGRALLQLELACAIAPHDERRADALRDSALDSLDRLGASALARRLTGPVTVSAGVPAT